MILARPTTVLLSLALAGVLGLSGCAPVLIGGAATAGVAVAQERTVGDAIDDTIISARVKDRLLQQSGNLFLRVSTEVLEGRVLLTGSVPNPQDRVEAVRIAWTVPGVREVLNEIQVAERGGIAQSLADARTTGTLRYQLMSDRNIVDINYSIDTVNGIVYLMGIAQNQAELDRVVGYARNLNGVRQVISHVVLRNDPRR
jgi:osmotically-inducible protein OsmY